MPAQRQPRQPLLRRNVVGTHVQNAAEHADRLGAVAARSEHVGARGDRLGIERLLGRPALGQAFGAREIAGGERQAEQSFHGFAAVPIQLQLALRP